MITTKNVSIKGKMKIKRYELALIISILNLVLLIVLLLK